MDSIETHTSELIITTSLNDLRASGAQLSKKKNLIVAESLISGNIDKEASDVAVHVKSFANYLTSFRSAREFFTDPNSGLNLYCEATGLNPTAVREKLLPETQLAFNTKLAQEAVTEYMMYRRSFVNKRKSD